ncbi:MAG: hypothetical protein KIS81_10845 [Maricaulaceae bacterium]|nr:hypothetical protein [Maricaulaceae bacterium]
MGFLTRSTAILTAAALGAALAACASPPRAPYQPAAQSQPGYSEMRIESNRWRVSYQAAGDPGLAAVEGLALRRAAELTLQNGDDWFIVASRRTDPPYPADQRRAAPRVSGGVGQTWGSGGYSGTSVGVGVAFGSSGPAVNRSVTLEVVSGAGERPDRDGAYDARSVLEHQGG